MIKVLQKGFMTLPVSTRRHGLERYGVAGTGPLDWINYTISNRLVSNADDAVALEINYVPPKLHFEAACAFAVAGHCAMTLTHADGTRTDVEPCSTCYAEAGDLLSGGTIDAGCRAYIAFAGGLSVPLPPLKPLADGDILALNASTYAPPLRAGQYSAPNPDEIIALHITDGVHRDRFSRAGLRAFTENVYTCSAQSDRMGMRLEGEPVEFAPGRDGNIISEPTLPGDIQVTSAGLPIIMLAECQTVGGYARIGHVISFDLARAGQIRPGQRLRFHFVPVWQAHAALKAANAALERAVQPR